MGVSFPSNTMVKPQIAEFKMGRTSTTDELRSGHPIEVTIPETIKNIHKIILADRRVKVSEMAETAGISTKQVRKILHEDLSMAKLCARWVLRLLTPEQNPC